MLRTDRSFRLVPRGGELLQSYIAGIGFVKTDGISGFGVQGVDFATALLADLFPSFLE